LQEVQANHFERDIYPELAAKGYEGIFKCKTREGKTGPGKTDGCATFFRRSLFHLVDTHNVEYNAIAMAAVSSGEYADPGSSHNDKILQRLLRGNVAQIAMLEMRGSGSSASRLLCVANTHIFWDPEYPDVKLWQTHQLLRQLDAIVGTSTPIILCGDFNSMPGSTAVQLLRDESVDPNNDEFAQDALDLFPLPEMVNHQLGFDSAYESVVGAEPIYTNYTGHYKGTLDYIFFSRQYLAAVAVLKVQEESVLRGPENEPLPNSQNPSDHIATVVDFNFLRYPRMRDVY